jgi:hypothetical protein
MKLEKDRIKFRKGKEKEPLLCTTSRNAPGPTHSA